MFLFWDSQSPYCLCTWGLLLVMLKGPYGVTDLILVNYVPRNNLLKTTLKYLTFAYENYILFQEKNKASHLQKM